MHRRAASRLTIGYPDGQTVHLTAGQPGVTLDDGRTLTLTGRDLRAAACDLVAHGLATVTGPAELAATVTRPELVAALACLALSTHRPARSHAHDPHPRRARRRA